MKCVVCNTPTKVFKICDWCYEHREIVTPRFYYYISFARWLQETNLYISKN